MSVEIIEILGRANEGTTAPFICRGNDKQIYFVKGMRAGRRSQICEWIAGCLAQKLQLPIAPFNVVHVPSAFLEKNTYRDVTQLGIGLAFGSLRQEYTIEVEPNHLHEIPDTLQQAIFAYDWWIQNMDRTLTEQGGNPNLLWRLKAIDPSSTRLVVIDHNLAFDKNFCKQDFIELHIFRKQWVILSTDKAIQKHYNRLFLEALKDWDAICNSVPNEWWFIDIEQTIPVDFDLNAIYDQLIHCKNTAFWDK
ncbi:HipA family kinase [Beggiatoa leptomitoformis]|uniref:HipA-like kinase domain-containing protein n=1 Tax=Beggiatoa leptomitoformis TaxID=288004 RepID=A0A2N9Y9V1_9GAMM|nr:HipA family kinase [Beggiatoa leptomitoformis]ALG67333.1 hypothetical protein AL038_05965 [Beggiatoa leptomitoformis]AUI67228.1 hypothetical protein BLE401_00005 [Beggiatoa leptomitoformis]